MLLAGLRHQRCISHVINLCYNSWLRQIHEDVLAIWNLLNSLRVSVRRNDLFEVKKIKLRQLNASLSGVNIETRRSYTFEMRLNAYSVLSVLNAVANRIFALHCLTVNNEQQLVAKLVQDFLKAAATVTNAQSRPLYVPLSISLLLFQRLVLKFEKAILGPDPFLPLIATAWLKSCKGTTLLCIMIYPDSQSVNILTSGQMLLNMWSSCKSLCTVLHHVFTWR